MKTVNGLAAQVQTVLGPVSVSDLGFTLMHAVLKFSPTGYDLDPTYRFDRDAALTQVSAKVAQAKKVGLRTIVDPSPLESRDAPFIQEVSRRTGVQIICATGLNREGFPSYFRGLSVERLAEVFTTELTAGVGAEHIRPGVIFAASSDPITPAERVVLQAAARTARDRNVRIITDMSGALAHRQLDILAEEGMPPHYVVFGGADKNADTFYHRPLLQRGSYLGFHAVGIDETWGLPSDEMRAQNIARLVQDGFLRQITMTHDCIAYFQMPERDMTPERRARKDLPKRRFTYLIEGFIPLLLQAGVSQQDIHTMTVENPRRFFSGEKP